MMVLEPREDTLMESKLYAAKSDVLRNCFFTISEVATCFRGSALRTTILNHGLEAAGIPNCAVHNYNDTRWVERHDCVAVFSDSCNEITWIFFSAMTKIEHVERMISEIRENCEKEFAVVYRNTQDKASKVGVLHINSTKGWNSAIPKQCVECPLPQNAVRKQFIDIEKAIEFYKDDLQDNNRHILEAE
ncbi:hypothetical protein PR048_004455 [Dryococelus australis]|uniref:Uncharacterized protein n=1 Tax=Dryococelus australis TaxID=614101 RepID=A0ABQ9I5H8_9NEOP|nr:hypothetical protein PR048_004455 [Dryococelus australis]